MALLSRRGKDSAALGSRPLATSVRFAVARAVQHLKGTEEIPMSILTKLREFLDGHHVRYEVRVHPQAFTAQEVAQAEHVSGLNFAKVVMLRDGGEFVMTVLPAPNHVDLDLARQITGKAGLQVAREEQFANLFPDCEPGAMPPFGNLYGMPVLVDRRLTQDEEIVFNAGSHTETVKMRYSDFAHLVKPLVGALSAPPTVH